VDDFAEGLQIAILSHTPLATLDDPMSLNFQSVASASFQVGDLLALKTLSGTIWTVEISIEENAQALIMGATGTPEPSGLVLLGVGLLGLLAFKKWVRP
jgi:glucose uptake protein GlcU